MQEPVIDWKLAIELAGNSREFAEKMFLQLANELTTELEEIKKNADTYDIKALKTRLHRLHGALCYCGAPRLKKITAAFEQALDDKKYIQIPALQAKLEEEAHKLIENVHSIVSS